MTKDKLRQLESFVNSLNNDRVTKKVSWDTTKCNGGMRRLGGNCVPNPDEGSMPIEFILPEDSSRNNG